jgi:hypothetical protein
MTTQHKDLSSGRWNNLSFAEQMANIGSEVGRAISWRNKDNQGYSQLALDRALELLDLTVSDKKNILRLREVLRTREALADYLFFDNSYHSTDAIWQSYFLAFNYAARIGKN